MNWVKKYLRYTIPWPNLTRFLIVSITNFLLNSSKIAALYGFATQYDFDGWINAILAAIEFRCFNWAAIIERNEFNWFTWHRNIECILKIFFRF